MQNLILNRYRPLEKAGSGGFATVLLAWDTRIQRRVAIKCLQLDHYGTAASPGTPRDIPGLEEARAAGMLSDSNIVSVYDFAVQGGMAYLIMEYMDGITLTELMRQEGGSLSLDVATCVFEAVAHALQVAHADQVLHLDIKPDNVLINTKGQVKVTDFGLAQLAHEAGYGQAAGGTIGYMPLEQMRLEAPDERTDEWALASLTYEMLLGENPFRAHNLAAAQRAIEDAELVIPSVGREDLDEEVDEAIFGALAIDREDRFESVALFADAVLPHLGDPRAGARELAAIVGEEEPDTEEVGMEDIREDGLQAPDVSADSSSNASKRGKVRPARVEKRFPPLRVIAALACCASVVAAVWGMPAPEALAGQEAFVFGAGSAVVLVISALFLVMGVFIACFAWAAVLLVGGSYAMGATVLVACALWLQISKFEGRVRAVLSAGVAWAVLVAGVYLQTYFSGGLFGSPGLSGWMPAIVLGSLLTLASFVRR